MAIHVGSIGTELVFPVIDEEDQPVDLSQASTKRVTLVKPDGSQVQRDCVLVTDGLDGKMKYTTVEGDLDQAGEWIAEGYVVTPAGSWPSDEVKFHIARNRATNL